MAELTFIAYVLSLVSIVLNIWLVSEIQDIKKERQRDLIKRRLDSIAKSVQPKRNTSYWG